MKPKNGLKRLKSGLNVNRLYAHKTLSNRFSLFQVLLYTVRSQKFKSALIFHIRQINRNFPLSQRKYTSISSPICPIKLIVILRQISRNFRDFCILAAKIQAHRMPCICFKSDLRIITKTQRKSA